MKIRGTLALVGLALAAILYLQYVELPKSDAAKETAEQAKQLAPLEPENVRALDVPLSDGGIARVVRADAGAPWKLEAPLAWAADEDAVNGIVSALDDLAIESEIKEIPADLALFGFTEPPRPLRVTLAEGDPIEIRLGGKAPIGSTRYVLRDGASPRLATVSESTLHSLMPALIALRDKQVVKLDPEEVDVLRVIRGGKLVVAAKRKPAASPEAEAAWEIAEPIAERGDAERIGRLLQDLSFQRATGFRDPPVDDTKTGLAAPEAEVELRAGDRVERVAFGRAEGKVFARAEGTEAIFEVPDRILTDLPGDLFAYREKQVAELPTDDAARLAIYLPRDSGQFAFLKKGNSDWVPTGSDVKVDSVRLEDLLYALRDLEATALVDGAPDLVKLGLEPPRVRVELADKDGKSLGWVELGDQTDDGVAARSSAGDRVWRVSKEIGQDVPLSLDSWNARWAKAAEDAAAAESPPPAAEPPARAE